MIELRGISTIWFKNQLCPSTRLSRLRAQFPANFKTQFGVQDFKNPWKSSQNYSCSYNNRFTFFYYLAIFTIFCISSSIPTPTSVLTLCWSFPLVQAALYRPQCWCTAPQECCSSLGWYSQSSPAKQGPISLIFFYINLAQPTDLGCEIYSKQKL